MVQEEQFVPSLETRPFGTPLQHFRGVLQPYTSEKVTPEGGGREYMRISFPFEQVEVIRSVEPYPFPVASIQINYSPTTETRWDALASSIRGLYGHTPALDELVGKRQVWIYGDCMLRQLDQDTKLWTTNPGQAWQVESIDGIGEGAVASVATPAATAVPGTAPAVPPATPAATVPDLNEHIMGLLDGRNEADFYQMFYADPEIRKDPQLITDATNRVLLSSLETAGRCWRDTQGIWHKGPNPNAGAPA